MALLTYKDAHKEAVRRFGLFTSRYEDFMQSWIGLMNKGKYNRDKYRNEFGCGRKARRGA